MPIFKSTILCSLQNPTLLWNFVNCYYILRES